MGNKFNTSILILTLHLQGTSSGRTKCFENRHCRQGNAIGSCSVTLGLNSNIKYACPKSRNYNWPSQRKTKTISNQMTYNSPLHYSAV
uniref:Putative peptide/nitrate transporter At3g43790 n=1 Tax=Rhizophora mucronata TaxID=61149 RepID=A0A2P2MM60_RHIMU